MTVVSKGECNALQVSNFTGLCRAIESNYLNQLSRMGWLNKRRVSKTTHFRVVSEKIFNKPVGRKQEAISLPEFSVGIKSHKK